MPYPEQPPQTDPADVYSQGLAMGDQPLAAHTDYGLAPVSLEMPGASGPPVVPGQETPAGLPAADAVQASGPNMIDRLRGMAESVYQDPQVRAVGAAALRGAVESLGIVTYDGANESWRVRKWVAARTAGALLMAPAVTSRALAVGAFNGARQAGVEQFRRELRASSQS